MGLTIHYSLKTRGSDVHAQKLVNALHQAAHDLPFKELGEVVTLSGEQCDLQQGAHQPVSLLLLPLAVAVAKWCETCLCTRPAMHRSRKRRC